MTMPPGRSQALGLTVSTTSFGYPHPDSDARRLTESAIVATLWSAGEVIPMKAISACEAKYNFGRMIDTARAEPVIVEKHGRPVVVVLAVEKYEKLTGEQISPSQDKSEN